MSPGENAGPLAKRRASIAAAMRHPSRYRLLAESEAPNPFIPKTYGAVSPPGERVARALSTIFLVPARLALIAPLLLSAFVVASAQICGLSDAQLREPFVAWRRLLQWVLRQHLRAMLFCIGYVHIPTRGAPASKAEAPIIVMNHHGPVEPAFLAWHTGATFVGAAENLRMPVVATLAAAMQVIQVDRSSPTSRAEVVNEIRRRAASPRFPQVAIFPEGTTTNGRALIAFKPGAFVPALSVQPALVAYPPVAGRVCAAWGFFDPSWVYGNDSLAGLAFGLLRQPLNRMEVAYLPPHAPSAAERADAPLFAENVRAQMAAELGVPTTGHSLDDVALQREARVLHLPVDKAVVEMSKLSGVFDVQRSTIRAVMERFARFDTAKRGELTLEQWLSALADGDEVATLELRPELEAAFRLLDVDETGTVSFREWLVGLLLVNSAEHDPTNAEALRFAWSTLAGSLEATLTRAQVLRLLLLPRGGRAMSEGAANAIFESSDDDGDGLISYAEFAAHASEHPELLRAFADRLIIRAPAVCAQPAPSAAAPAAAVAGAQVVDARPRPRVRAPAGDSSGARML
ncbi:hypothetical protein KFE25_011052 [Diacronema lutheri]|mgnify:CR=1 FL=1|uniref:EF-hand domain-containing protein n=2 Tax=Diacronema lutheri TaxID=2081491 RepID=A0A8J5XAR0_DIALT|nr:hypothetical protein KFE25_011052 [Diacronema lutheri]